MFLDATVDKLAILLLKLVQPLKQFAKDVFINVLGKSGALNVRSGKLANWLPPGDNGIEPNCVIVNPLVLFL